MNPLCGSKSVQLLCRQAAVAVKASGHLFNRLVGTRCAPPCFWGSGSSPCPLPGVLRTDAPARVSRAMSSRSKIAGHLRQLRGVQERSERLDRRAHERPGVAGLPSERPNGKRPLSRVWGRAAAAEAAGSRGALGGPRDLAGPRLARTEARVGRFQGPGAAKSFPRLSRR